MRARERILGAFGIRPGETSRVAWLVAHSLFIGLFSAFFLTAANALFLDRFEISRLPLAYIAGAVVGYLVLMLFSRLEKRVPLERLLVVNLLLLLVVAGAFWVLALATASRWVVFFMFVWVGPAFSLLSLGYWALAARLFDLRQGKRLFGLVGAGEEVSTVVGLFSVPLLVRSLGGPTHLLLVALAGLAGCLAVVLAIRRRFGEALGRERGERASGEVGRRAGFADLLRSRYFLLMASLIVLATLANYTVDFSFLSEVRARFEGSTSIAQFIGLFFGVTKVLELVLKAFLSGRLLGQFGLRFGLLVLPVLLASCVGFAMAIGSLGLGATHFFVLVALAKLVWVVMRTSMFEPSFRVLYQPVRAVDRLSFQTHVEGTAKQVATGVVGLALLAFSRAGSLDALALFYALVPLLGAWMVASLRAHRDYRAKLIDSLSARVLREGAKRPVDVLKPHLVADRPRDRTIALAVLGKVEPVALPPALAEMLAHPHRAVRLSALEYVCENELVGLEAAAAECARDADPTVQGRARQTLQRLRDAEAARADTRVDDLLGSTLPTERALAARAIARGAGENAEKLWVLLFDGDWAVRRAALAAAGRLGKHEFWPQIIGELASPLFSGAAASALIEVGEPALGELERAFNKADQAPIVRQRILKIYEAIGGGPAQALLVGKLAFPDAIVRGQALIALSRSGYRADAEHVPLVERAIERLIGDMAWKMSAVLDLGEDGGLPAVGRALEEEIESGRSRLFLLLSLLLDPWAVGLVKQSLESGSSEATVYALEIMDLLTSDRLKPLVLPVLEGLTYPQALKRLETSCPRHRLEPLERLRTIVNRDSDGIGAWTRACAVRALGERAGRVLPDLVASLFHPNPLVHEAAALSLCELDPEACLRYRRKLGYDTRERLEYVLGPEGTREHWESRSVLGRAAFFRGLPAFSKLPSEALVRLAAASEELVLKPLRRLPSPRAPRDAFYVLVDGEVATANGKPAGARRAVPAQYLFAFGPGAPSLEVVQTSCFIRLDPDQLYELAGEYVELIPPVLGAQQQILEVEERPPEEAPS
jgi:ATP/ADP translocase